MKRSRLVQPLTISFVLLVALVAVFTLGNPSFLSQYNVTSVLNAVTILLAVGLGQVCVILTGGIDLSVGSIMSLVSVVLMMTVGRLGPGAYPVVALIGLLSGLLNGLIVSKLKIPSFIATLGTQGVLVSVAYLLSPGPLTAAENLYGVLDFVNGHVGPIQATWIISAGMLAIYYLMQRFTPLGRQIIYIGANERMSWLAGLDIDRARILAFAFSGFGAAVAGMVLSATLYSGYPTMGLPYVLNSIAVVVVGGTAMTGGAGGVVNTVVGALIMGVIQNGLTVIGVDAYGQQVFLGILVIIAVALTFDRAKVAIIK
ncbi:MAG TPA: ABC transporter permease [Anaeromyxobacter sp.]|nr:ABC transporter permease [Anaeromyxobacter sp.]